MNLPKPPKHLSAASAAWWRELVAAYEFEAADLRLLEAAAQAWDRWSQARRAVAAKGLTYTDGKGITRMRPEVVIEKDARAAFAKLVRQLGLDQPEQAEAPSRRKAETYWSRWRKEKHGIS